jgi:hypothetical protein
VIFSDQPPLMLPEVASCIVKDIQAQVPLPGRASYPPKTDVNVAAPVGAASILGQEVPEQESV